MKALEASPVSLVVSPARKRFSVAAAFGVLGFALSLSACSDLIAEDSQDLTANTCESNGECGGGFCRDGMCQTNTTKLPSLLLEITPPSGTETAEGSPNVAGIAFTQVVEQFELGPTGYAIELGHVSVIKGKVYSEPVVSRLCLSDEALPSETSALDGSFPVRLTMTPRARLLGLSNPAHTVALDSHAGIELPETTFEFALAVPPGRYDLYVEPTGPVDGCVRPPYLVVDQEIKGGDVGLNLELPSPQILEVRVRYPHQTDDLKDFILDVVDRDTGRLLSNRATLGVPVQTADSLDYQVRVAFSEVTGEQGAEAAELVRLSPPESAVAPTLYVERSVVDLFQDGQGLIDQLVELPAPVDFGAPVTRQGSTEGVQATVTLVARSLAASTPGTVAAFSRTLKTNEAGFFETQLLPGVYRLIVEPFDSTLARTEQEITVAASSEAQVGKSIVVSERRAVTGKVVSFDGTSVYGAPLWVSSAPEEEFKNVLKLAQGEKTIRPGASAMSTEQDGRFQMLADEGLFHVAVRPEVNTHFAWRILLGVEVGSESLDLGRIALPLPVVVPGELTSADSGTTVSGALIRAYAFLKDGELVKDPAEATAVVPVGEARSGELGRFELLLPSVLK